MTRFGAFVRLEETGADGLCPISSLGREYFTHDERAHALVGESTGGTYRLGMAVEVKLVEATPVTGGLLLEIQTEPEPGKPVKHRRGKPRRHKDGGRSKRRRRS